MRDEDQLYEPEWISISKIAKMPVLPEEIKGVFLIDLSNNFVDCPKEISLDT